MSAIDTYDADAIHDINSKVCEALGIKELDVCSIDIKIRPDALPECHVVLLPDFAAFRTLRDGIVRHTVIKKLEGSMDREYAPKQKSA